ncbi:MAG: signal peptidase I [Oscillospiraceae bacterium]|jgi:signal peptidase I|nr:signal peptidase I [Oscillospiraceae bacterium]
MRPVKEYWVPLRTAPEPLPQRHPLRLLYELAASLTMALALIFVVFVFLFRPIRVDGSSMRPTLHDGDWLLVSAFSAQPERGRVAVLAESGSLHKPLVKRVIALPGDVVDIDFVAGVVTVNNIALEEPYIAEPTYNRGNLEFPLTVEPGTCFVLGDNRNHSTDSRFAAVGLVDQRNIIGQMLLHFSVFDHKTNETE